MAKELNHFNTAGEAVMVDVGAKETTGRRAVAVGRIVMRRETFEMVKNGTVGKGDVLGVARVAGIMATKRCADLIPLCHPLMLEKAEVDFTLLEDEAAIEVRCTAQTSGKTGVEMEALCGVNVALLTIYDMCKAADRGMRMEDIHLLEKSGGQSGHYIYKAGSE